MNEIQTTKQTLANKLSSYYSHSEAEHIACVLLEEAFGHPYPMLVIGDYKVNEKLPLLQQWVTRLIAHEPLQYVLGHTDFCGIDIKVRTGALIPRPETEQLCDLLRSRGYLFDGAIVADVCTGSGAIALFMAMCGATVEAIELSPIALSVSRENFDIHAVSVDLRAEDILSDDFTPKYTRYDLVVSNPPYILRQERDEMMPHVVEQEPDMALFVPDDDPLIFYRRIKELYQTSRVLAFEINPLCVKELKSLFSDRKVEFLQDFNHKTRYLIVI